jgi:hypothetical protein
VNHFLEIILPVFGFNFFFWVTGVLLGTVHGDFSLPLMALLLVVFVGVFA